MSGLSDQKTGFEPIYKKTYIGVVIAAAMMIFLFVLIGSAHAHRVIVYASIEGNTVHTASKFPSSDTKVSGGTIKVYDGSGNLLLTGKTDDKGKFSFPIPKKSALRIVISAGPGHQGEWRLSEKKIRTALGDSQPTKTAEGQSPSTKSEPSKKAKKQELPADRQQEITPVVKQEVKKALAQGLDKKLDEKLTPIRDILVDMKNPGPSVSEILGGIGYIIGLFGIAAYIYSRKQ